MNQRWSLDELYTSFDSDEFKCDFHRLEDGLTEIGSWVEKNTADREDSGHKIERYITMLNDLSELYSRLEGFSGLTLSVDAGNQRAAQAEEILRQRIAALARPQVKFQRWLLSIADLERIISERPLLREHRFYLNELAERGRYILSEDEEVLLARMRNTGSDAWSDLQRILTSTLQVDITINGSEKHLPLPVVRNIAYDSDRALRKNAYESELKSYKKIEESSAACLNGIKGEVITVSDMRGYSSPLEETVINSRMDMDTLNTMLSAMKESMPYFRRFYRKKARLLGYEGGLPFYDLFAPVGKKDLRFTYDEAREYIVKNFATFSRPLADFADLAFEKRWIDAEPRNGKRGGAFCSNLHAIGESRIMSNFTGSFSDVVTLSHEIGHGYHGSQLMDQSYLNSDYPMPIAETASTFCETIIKNAAMKDASDEEAFPILESDISDSAQVIVDIYSRFLFESELFRRRAKSSLSVSELKGIMIESQKEAYGDGLDQNFLHPYMWINKPHYYYADSNFYNFPYAFGLLFAKGLYAEYQRRGSSFVEDYDRLLSITGKNRIADITSSVGIDIHSMDFWRSSLKLIEDEIEHFLSLK